MVLIPTRTVLIIVPTSILGAYRWVVRADIAG